MKAITVVLAAHRYGELEKRIQRSDDSAEKKRLERELLYAMRMGAR